MPTFLLVGLAFSEIAKNPAPPGLTSAEFEQRIRAGLERTTAQFEQAGAGVEMYNAGPSDTTGEFEKRIREKPWDAILIGAGLRTIPKYTELFERLINTARVHVPNAYIIFNTAPDDTFEAAKRWFPNM